MTRQASLARVDRGHAVDDGARLRGHVLVSARGYEARDDQGGWLGVFPIRIEAVRCVLRGVKEAAGGDLAGGRPVEARQASDRPGVP